MNAANHSGKILKKLLIGVGACVVLALVFTIFLRSRNPSRKEGASSEIFGQLPTLASFDPTAAHIPLPESVRKEAEEILANARANIDKIQNGRITLRKRHVMAMGITKQGYEANIRYYPEYWRKQGWNEKEIQAELEKRKAEWKKQLSIEGYDTVHYEGEYVFEGDNAYATVTSEQLRNKSYSAYIYENRIISLERWPDSGRIAAHISEGSMSGNKALEPPFLHLQNVAKVTQHQSRWQLAEVSDKSGEKIFGFTHKEHPEMRLSLLIPEEGYVIEECSIVYSAPGSGTTYSFEGFVHDPVADVFYPTKTSETTVADGKIRGQYTSELLEVELNRDYDDELFRAPLKEGTQITDYRFDPPKQFQLNIAELPGAYFNGLHVRLEPSLPEPGE